MKLFDTNSIFTPTDIVLYDGKVRLTPTAGYNYKLYINNQLVRTIHVGQPVELTEEEVQSILSQEGINPDDL